MAIITFSSGEISLSLAAVAAGDPLCQILPAQAIPAFQGTKRIGITRLRMELKTAVATLLGLTIPSTVGTATTFSFGQNVSAPVAGNGGVPISGRLVSAWGPAPTFPGSPVYLRQGITPGLLVGEVIEWTWPEDDPFSPSSMNSLGVGIVVQNIGGGASAALLVNARWKEFGA